MNRKHFLLIALVALAGGSIPPFAKLALESFGPFTLVFFRFLAASIVMYFFMPKKELSLKHMVNLRWVGIVGALNPIFIFLALQHIQSNITALFYAIIPGLGVAYLWLLRGEKTSATQLAGFALGLIGVGIISLQTVTGKADGGNPWVGITFMLIAVFSFFAYGIMSKERQRSTKISGTALAFYFAVITTVLSLPFAVYETVQQPWFGHVAIIPLLATLYLGFIGTGAQYLLYQRALKVMEAAQANIFIYLQPIITVVLAALLVGEAITWQIFLAGVIILFGARLALSTQKAK
ncbi:TPA: hypothetical protein DIV49_02195 [Candidatus Saccharibacteria bacterium]|nr:hypothetical protein [Candidatus Saccharibacteria bacterium]HRJ90700.1 DMT family transporter [Candidatus Saccharibacteria bacterium]